MALHHVAHYSVDPGSLPGNIENFMGVAQVPLGLAGPLLVNGEHAQGEFFVPLATTEGTLVASYNRGMRLLTESGGVRTTVLDESMQRSPVFVFDDALAGRHFGEWVREHMDEIRARAESTTSVGKLTRSASTASAICGTCASTTRRVTRRARTCAARRRSRRASGSSSSTPTIRSSSCPATSTPTRSTRRST